MVYFSSTSLLVFRLCATTAVAKIPATGRACCARALLGAGLAIAVGWSSFILPATAQEWPSRYVKVVVPYGAGGISDVIGRITAERLSKKFGQSFVVEARPGANGAIGTEYVARSPADGYTLYEAGGAQFSVVPLMQKLSYDPVKDLAPISMIASNGMALVINRGLPVQNVKEFIDYARANPGKINYGSVGRGASSSLVPAAFALKVGLKFVEVPYTGAPAAITDLLSGNIQMFFGNVSDIVSIMRSDKVRVLGISTEKRLPEFSDVPTIAETVPGFVVTAWNGYFAPAGTPKPIIERLSRALGEIGREPEVIQAMAKLGVDSVTTTPEELAAAIQADLPIYRAAAEASGLIKK